MAVYTSNFLILASRNLVAVFPSLHAGRNNNSEINFNPVMKDKLECMHIHVARGPLKNETWYRDMGQNYTWARSQIDSISFLHACTSITMSSTICHMFL